MEQKKHTVENIKPELEIDENLDLHETGWKFQRFGISFIFFLVVLGAIGMFGNGLVSKRTVATTGAEISFDRFFRREARMEITIDATTATGNSTVVGFPNHYIRNFRIESILPEPSGNKVEANAVNYVFEGTPPLHIVFYLVPQQAGSISGTITVNNNSVPVSHFIYP